MSRRANDLSVTDIQQLPHFSDSNHFSELEKAVLQYATEMSETPVQISEENFAILQQEFSPKQMVELTSSIAWENWRARYNHALGIESAEFEADLEPNPAATN